VDVHPEKNGAGLIGCILTGDPNAFERFIREHERLVFHVVCRMVTNAADREDLCQDVFLKIYKNLAGFRRESKISTWVARIAYNTCLNHLKKKKPTLLEDCLDAGGSDGWADTAAAPDEQAESGETTRRLQEELARLALPYRTALTLYHLEDMPVTDIARVMDLPEGTVKSLLFRARRILKNRLAFAYEGELCR
jgi:RNA polymerase sigma-70 factor (ECF subfamily)